MEQRSTDGGTLLQRLDFKYDDFGDRIEKDVTINATTTVTHFGYDGDNNIWADLNGSNALQTHRFYLDAVDSVFARQSSSGTTAWYLPDRLGSVRNIVDASGSLIDTISYDGFGVVTNESSSSNGDRYKWTGRELDSETGLQLNGERFYDAKTGRWLSEDPLGLLPDSNPYRYVGNNSQNFTDPAGLEAQQVGPLGATIFGPEQSRSRSTGQPAAAGHPEAGQGDPGDRQATFGAVGPPRPLDLVARHFNEPAHNPPCLVVCW